MFFEIVALVTFLPEFQCLQADDICKRDSVLSRVGASVDAIIGESHAEAARGGVLIGLTALRLFGLIRHWKQMFINNTFSRKQEGIEKWLIPRGKDTGNSIMSARTKRNSSKKNEVRIILLSLSRCITVGSLITIPG